MQVGDIVIAPIGCNPYFTPNKEYIVEGFWSITNIMSNGHSIQVRTDIGVLAHCFEKKCNHLNGGDWILKPTSHDNSQDDKTIIK